MEVTNRFNATDLIDRVSEELWMEVCNIVTGGGEQKHLQEKEMQNVCLRRHYKYLEKKSERQGRKGEVYLFECRVPKNSKES